MDPSAACSVPQRRDAGEERLTLSRRGDCEHPGQTWTDFEFVILDDGSDDDSLEILHRWAERDARIRVVEGGRSRGPVGSSNLVVAHSRAPIVARMDADDVATPDRLERQLQALDRNPDAVLVGSVWEGIDRQGRVVRDPDLSALFANRFAAPFAHGSIMFRRSAFDKVGGYRRACEFWEDLDLSLRMARHGRFSSCPARSIGTALRKRARG